MTSKLISTAKSTAPSTSNAGIGDYARKQSPELVPVFDALRAEIAAALPRAASKIWHGAPVWFVDDYPVVG